MSDEKLTPERLLQAEDTLRELQRAKAKSFKESGSDWPRDWVERHSKVCNALLIVRDDLVNESEKRLKTRL